MKQQFRICALCKYFVHKRSGQEFEGIADTSYEVYSCKLLGWTRREDALMESEPKVDMAEPKHNECPFWESWDDDEGTLFEL